MIIQSLLDTDLYKLTMQQVVFHQFPQATAEYRFTCRSREVDLRPFAAEIRQEIDALCELAFTDEELAHLRTIRYLTPAYVDSLRGLRLNPNDVEIITDGEFALTIRGSWYGTILFEVPLLAIINEVYFRNTHPMTAEVRAEGQRRLVEKCRLIRETTLPQFALVEFGTRRRYSREWQVQVIETLKRDVPQSLIGTSNVEQAWRQGLVPFGTMAHEFLQACQAFAPLPEFQKFALETWMKEYRGDLGIALSDVVGMDAFLRDFDKLFSKAYDGARHDSGDPVAWGEKLIAHYQRHGIDPTTKFAVWSDGLTIPKALDIAHHFEGRIHTSFGVGTNLTNDLGFPALQIVLKMARCNDRPVAKLSDTPGKAMATDETFLAYLRQTFRLTPTAPVMPETSALKSTTGRAAL
jgi:nicotinate phosphoribosyltransferase